MKAKVLKRFAPLLFVALFVAIVAIATTGMADSNGEAANMFVGTAWSLFPPLVAIALALITKEVYSSLFAGVVVGALFAANFNLEQTMLAVVDNALIAVLRDGWNVGILIFLVLLGAISALAFKSGATVAYGEWAQKRIKTRTGAQLATVALGCLIFVDDYFNCLTVGNVMRPVTDSHGISRAKLAYIVDATAAPVCIIAPISSWAAAVTAFAQGYGDSPYALFIDSIQYNFYALFTIAMMITILLLKFDYGPMKLHEDNAVKGDLYTTPDRPYANADNEIPNKNGKVMDLIIPIFAVLIPSCILGLLYTGGFFGGESFMDAFANCDASRGLVYGSLVAMLIMLVYFLLRKTMSFKEFMDCLPQGFRNMVPAILILVLAWSLSAVTGMLGAADYVAELVHGSARGFVNLLPAIIFLVGCGLSFATGTSWGTFGILLPIVIEVFPVGNPLLVVSVSACLAGAVFGDHCSPISDTTIMASAGAQSNHINHVATQLPYAVTVGIICFVFYIIAGFWQSFIVTILGILATVGVLFVIKRIVTKPNQKKATKAA